MKKLCVFTLYDDKGGSSQYRTFLYKERLEKDFSCKWFPFWSNTYVTKYMHNKRKYIIPIFIEYICSILKRLLQVYFVASKCDIIYIQKSMIPKLKPKSVEYLKKLGKRIVFDVDDAVYLEKKDYSGYIAKYSDVIVCGNDTLLHHYQEINSNSIIIPTVDDTNKYVNYWKDTFDDKIIGWIGTQTTAVNIEIVKNAINQIIKKHPQVSFTIISNSACGYNEVIGNCRLVKWDKGTYIKELSRITIGIMPLLTNEYNKGKCGFKLVQYLSMKKPVIGTGLGVNTQIINGNGIIAESEEEWIEALEKLLFDREYYDMCIKHIEDSFLNEYHIDYTYGNLKKALMV